MIGGIAENMKIKERRMIETYVKKFEPAPEDTRPSLLFNKNDHNVLDSTVIHDYSINNVSGENLSKLLEGILNKYPSDKEKVKRNLLFALQEIACSHEDKLSCNEIVEKAINAG